MKLKVYLSQGDCRLGIFSLLDCNVRSYK